MNNPVRDLNKFFSVLKAIAPWREKYQGRTHAETIECPACKGRLHLAIASNGHVRGTCETLHCVTWRE